MINPAYVLILPNDIITHVIQKFQINPYTEILQTRYNFIYIRIIEELDLIRSKTDMSYEYDIISGNYMVDDEFITLQLSHKTSIILNTWDLPELQQKIRGLYNCNESVEKLISLIKKYNNGN